jgi:Ca-activated chloride channel family protein
VIQRFRNPGDHATEAIYAFPLPADAAVSAMAIQIDARTIRAAIEPREAAQRRYEAAIAAGVAAAVLDEERADVFTQSIAAIPPHGVVEVTLRYDAVARYQAGRWELVVPMVVAPRHVPGTANGRATTGSGRAPDTDRAPDASRVTPAAAPGAGGSTAIAIHFVDEPAEITSPTHVLGGTRRDATLSDPASDHDAIVRWRAPAPSAGWIERDGDAGFAAVVVEAPPAAPRARALRFTLALDRAATTRGDADTVEHLGVRALLGGLGPADRVAVIGGDPRWRAPGDVLPAIERAWATPPRAFDLTAVLAAARPDGAPIVVVTDGLVADDPAAIAAAHRLGVAVHVIGVGPAPARATLRQLAAVTGGTVRFAVAGDDLAALVRDLLADLASAPPPLTVTWGTLAASDVEPVVLPRLGAGQAVVVVARVAHVQVANARARGDVFAFVPLAPGRAVDGAITGHGALARRWARERLGDLLAGPHDRKAVTELAIGYGLVSPYTSLVAIGSDVIVEGGVKRSVALPVSFPAGMQWHAVQQAIERDARVPVGEPVTRAPAPPAPTAVGPDESHGDDDSGVTGKPELIIVTGDRRSVNQMNSLSLIDVLQMLPNAAPGHGRLLLTGSLGGGLVLDHGVHGLVAAGLRLGGQLGADRRTQLGGEAALWLVDGRDPEGRVLLDVARRGPGRWFELGAGAGVQFGRGTGVAGTLRFSMATPIRRVAGVLRYDAAARVTRPTVELEHAITLGLELSY